jgi:hypothetical protein
VTPPVRVALITSFVEGKPLSKNKKERASLKQEF